MGMPRKANRAAVSVSLDGSTIYLTGDIESATFFEFMRVLRTNPKAKTVFLSSPGGNLIEGYLIGNAVRARKLDTQVAYLCASSCTLIFANGNQRVLGQNGRLGLHRSFQLAAGAENGDTADYAKPGELEATFARSAKFAVNGPGDEKIIRALRRTPVSDGFIRKALMTEPETMWYPAGAETLAEGLVTRQVDTASLGLPPSHVGLEKVREELLANRFWQAFAAHDAGAFDALTLEIWSERNSGIPWIATLRQKREGIDFGQLGRAVGQPDELLDQFALYLGKVSALQREHGYPDCKPPNSDVNLTAETALDTARTDADALFAALLESKATVVPPDQNKAMSLIRKNSNALFAAGLPYAPVSEDDAGHCQYNYRMFEAIGRLEPKRRATVLRAILVRRSESIASESGKRH